MKNIFHYDSPLNRFLSRVVDLIFLNLLWTVCCIPVITIGASTTAMYVCLRRLDSDTGHVAQNFFQAFRARFRVATCFWLGILVVAAALIWNFWLLYAWDFTGKTVLLVFLIAILALVLMLVSWFFPLLAAYDEGLKKSFRNSAALGLLHPWTSLELMVLNALPAALLLFRTDWFNYSLIFWALIGEAVIAWLCHLLTASVFRQHTQDEPQASKPRQ